MALSPEGESVSWAWGAISGAVNSGNRSTEDIWAAVRTEAERLGVDLSGAFAGVNELRSLAVQQRNAGVAFSRTDPAAEFTRALAPWDINARAPGDANLLPEYLVRFDMTHVNPAGEEETFTRTVRDSWRPDMTVGDVSDAVFEAAAGLANDYGVQLVGVSNLRPVSI